MNTEWDCVVIGGGVAGLSAALVLGRARRRTLVLDRGGQSNRPAPHVGGLLGHEGTAPAELYGRAREQLAGYDAVLIEDAEAVDARAGGDDLAVAPQQVAIAIGSGHLAGVAAVRELVLGRT